jgi:hypothetical protein
MLKLVEFVGIEGTHYAKKFQISLGGWIYLLVKTIFFLHRPKVRYVQKRGRTIRLTVETMPMSFLDSLIFKELVDPYFEKETLKEMPFDLHSSLIRFIRDSLEELIADANSIKKGYTWTNEIKNSQDPVALSASSLAQRNASNRLLQFFILVFSSTPEERHHIQHTILGNSPEYSGYEESFSRFIDALRKDMKFSKYVFDLESRMELCFSNYKRSS